MAFSEYDYPVEGEYGYEEQKLAKCGPMRGKPGVSKANLFAIFLLMFFLMGSDADVIQSVSYLLNSDFYGLDKEKASKVNSNAASYASFVSIPMLLLGGFMFELIGRRITLVFLLVMGGVSTILFPIVAPSIIGFDLCRIMFQMAMVPILTNTLVNDYVQVADRGKATAI